MVAFQLPDVGLWLEEREEVPPIQPETLDSDRGPLFMLRMRTFRLGGRGRADPEWSGEL